MADCSKTEVFLKEVDRMFDECCDLRGLFCESCSIKVICDSREHDRKLFLEEALDFVQQWSDEHPAPKPKTYIDYFYESFPRAKKTIIGIPCICRRQLFDQGRCDTTDENCDCVKCWNEPYRGEETVINERSR